MNFSPTWLQRYREEIISQAYRATVTEIARHMALFITIRDIIEGCKAESSSVMYVNGYKKADDRRHMPNSERTAVPQQAV